MTPTGYAFLADLLGSVSLAEGATADPFVPGAPFQLMKAGTFYSPVYGKISITPADLQTIYTNFKTRTPLAPTQLPIDYDHLSDDPQKPEDGKAAGWIQDLELKPDGTIWAEPKWTQRAAQMIAQGEYRFISPFFLTNYQDKNTGKKIGPTLKAAAITNRPFLEGMSEIPAPSIAASDRLADAAWRHPHIAVPSGYVPRQAVMLADVDPAVGGGVDRDTLPESDFAGQHRSYPIVKPGDVRDAASSIGRAGPSNYSADQLKANITRIARRKGAAFVAQLPDAWKQQQHREYKGVTTMSEKHCAACGAPSTRNGEAIAWADETVQEAGTITCPHCGAPVKYAVAAEPGELKDAKQPPPADELGEPPAGGVDALDDGSGDADAMKDLAGKPPAKPPVPPAATELVEPASGAATDASTETLKDAEGMAQLAEEPKTPSPAVATSMTDRTVKALQQQVRQLSEKNAETEKALKDVQRRERRKHAYDLVMRGKREGKVTPRMAGTWEKPGWALSEAYHRPDAFVKWLDTTAPIVVDMTERGTGKEEASQPIVALAEQHDRLTREAMTADPKLTYADAARKVNAQHRSLAESYDRTMSVGRDREFQQVVSDDTRRR